MQQTDPRVDAHFAELVVWKRELQALRQILLASPLVEEFKWRSPVYTWRGANVAIIWGFKDHATIGFFKGVLLGDPKGILSPPGDNSRSSRVAHFTDPAQVDDMRPVLAAYIEEAIEIEKAGQKVDFAKDDLMMPEELTQSLSGDAELATAFDALTPGRRRSWILHVSQAKQTETRFARIEKARLRILAGKGLSDR